jgi:hypothetical protein
VLHANEVSGTGLSSKTWVVVPKVVVVRVCLFAEILPGEPERHLEHTERSRVLIRGVDAKGFRLLPLPPELLIGVVDRSGCV